MGLPPVSVSVEGTYQLPVLFRLCKEERAEYQTPHCQHGYGREVQGRIEHHHAVVLRRSGINHRACEVEAIGHRHQTAENQERAARF